MTAFTPRKSADAANQGSCVALPKEHVVRLAQEGVAETGGPRSFPSLCWPLEQLLEPRSPVLWNPLRIRPDPRELTQLFYRGLCSAAELASLQAKLQRDYFRAPSPLRALPLLPVTQTLPLSGVFPALCSQPAAIVLVRREIAACLPRACSAGTEGAFIRDQSQKPKENRADGGVPCCPPEVGKHFLKCAASYSGLVTLSFIAF